MMNGKRKTQSQRIALFLIIFAIIIVVMGTLFLCSQNAQAASAERPYKYYTSVQVKEGDTLWKIADTYITEECGSMADYIAEICLVNHISENDIHVGQYITIPYYSGAYLE